MKKRESVSQNGRTERVSLALDAVYARALRRRADGQYLTLDAGVGRYVFFSDLHRGARNGADDFQLTERVFNAALAYYNRLGYTLVLVGDIEELWEERPAGVLKSYRRSYELEAAFHRAGRYIRIWGNHDDAWQYPRWVATRLNPVLGPPAVKTYESLLIDVMEGDVALGQLFVVHGHQGDRLSDRWAWFSRWVVRYLWRPFQRLTRLSLNTPATSWDLSHRLNRAIYAWASRQSGLVVIAGHTHRPVFESQSHAARIAAELGLLELEADDPSSQAQLEAQALLLAKLEWIRATGNGASRLADSARGDRRLEIPCYFNAGCSCYEDGDITGLEIVGGEIRLIRWPNDAGDAAPHILASGSLRDVLARCRAS